MSRVSCERGISYDQQREVYYLYLDYGRDKGGRRVRCYQTYPTLKDARQAKTAFQLQRTEDRQGILPATLTLRDWLEEWMRDIVTPTRAQTTIYGYQRMIHNYILPLLGDIPLQKLSPRDLQGYYAYLARECDLEANTIRHHHALLAAALHAAQRQELLERCATDRAEPPRLVQKEASFYTAEDLRRLYALLEGHRLETVVHLAGSLGLRREEICGLRWDCVDFRRRTIAITAARTTAGALIVDKDTKNRSSCRMLYMGDDIFQLLLRDRERQQERKSAMGNAWPETRMVAVDDKGQPYAPNRLTEAFTRFVRQSGLPPITLHGLRHSFATVASAQGAPLFDIGKALGHSTPSTTGRIYTHLSDQFHAQTLGRVADALGPARKDWDFRGI